MQESDDTDGTCLVKKGLADVLYHISLRAHSSASSHYIANDAAHHLDYPTVDEWLFLRLVVTQKKPHFQALSVACTTNKVIVEKNDWLRNSQ
jgi:hypothetical protein